MAETVKAIKEYGSVIVEAYTTEHETVYRVLHKGCEAISPSWFDNKREAIIHAQFLAAKY